MRGQVGDRPWPELSGSAQFCHVGWSHEKASKFVELGGEGMLHTPIGQQAAERSALDSTELITQLKDPCIE